MRLAAFLSLLLASCGPQCLQPYGTPGEDRCDATYAALGIIDRVYERHGLVGVSEFVRVVWVEGESFSIEDEEGWLWGRAEPGPIGCNLYVATRLQPYIHRTSLAHEVRHCALVLSANEIDGDPDHSDHGWATQVAEANLELAWAGL